jgi:phospholipid transport system substrate-binding protein
MRLSRRLLLALPPAALLARRAAAETAAAPATVIERFYGVLLAVMKTAKQVSFDQRYARLTPAVAATFNLPLMTRIAVGPDWSQFTAEQQQRLDAAFSQYTISEYANRFDDYGGERFTVDPDVSQVPAGTMVKSRIVKSNGETVELNYLMRPDAAGAWKVIDVYLDGTISQLAARRSEFVSVLQRSGANGLIELIERRAATLRPG